MVIFVGLRRCMQTTFLQIKLVTITKNRSTTIWWSDIFFRLIYISWSLYILQQNRAQSRLLYLLNSYRAWRCLVHMDVCYACLPPLIICLALIVRQPFYNKKDLKVFYCKIVIIKTSFLSTLLCYLQLAQTCRMHPLILSYSINFLNF